MFSLSQGSPLARATLGYVTQLLRSKDNDNRLQTENYRNRLRMKISIAPDIESMPTVVSTEPTQSRANARRAVAERGRWVKRLSWGNLLVARQSAVPAILVENAYMIFPDQEALLNDAAFREELAKALVEGLEGFLRASRRRP